jgi:O-antigen biosynthesis protein WbqP
VLTALAIVVDSGWPPLVRQRRIGVHGQEFLMWKFRTLPKDTPQVAKSDLEDIGRRASRFGRFLRRTSVDELPQLLNVLAGQMSLVGPRPALFNQMDLTQMRLKNGVLRVLPGLTGLAQVSGRENLSLEEKVQLDEQYVRTMSPAVDLGIAFRTIGAVLNGRGNR